MTIELIITTPEREIYRDTADSVTIPTTEGEITVLPNHVPLSTIMKAGELVIRKNGQEHPHVVGGGFIEVQPHKLVILADTAERIEEIDEQRAEEAIERAKKLQTEIHKDHIEFAGLAAKMERDLSRLKIARKYRHRGHHEITHEGIRKD